MDGDPAIAGVGDGDAQDLAAAHGVAGEMEMNGITAEHPLLPEVVEARIANTAAAISVIHGVAAHPGGIGAFHDDVAREIRDFATELATAGVLLRERLVDFERRPVDAHDAPLLGPHFILIILG